MDEATVAMGFPSLKQKLHLPMWLLMTLAYICEAIHFCLGVTLKLNFFNVKMLTMHRWFNIAAAESDLGYKPVVSYKEGWADTLKWFSANWLPAFDARAGMTGLATNTQAKIDIQAAGTAQSKKAI